MIHAAVISFSLLYAFLRYIVFGPVDPIHIPVYILNKSVSMAAVFYLCVTAYYHYKGSAKKTQKWGSIAFSVSGFHILLSLTIFSPSYYGKFFLESGKLNGIGEFVIVSGALAYFGWIKMRPHSATPQARYFLALFCSSLISVHLIVMGFNGWLTPEKWHGGMPPVSLVAFIASIVAFTLFLKKNSIEQS